MSEPDRIWAFPKKGWFNAGASTHKIKAAGAKDVEYLRATPAREHAEELAEALRDVLGRYQVTHCHSAARAALAKLEKEEGK